MNYTSTSLLIVAALFVSIALPQRAHTQDTPPIAIENLEELRERREVLRRALCQSAPRACQGRLRPTWAEINDEDRPDSLLHGMDVLRRLDTMEKLGLTTGALSQFPWSDSYWPIQLGAIARRFADPAFPDSRDTESGFQTNHHYFISRPPETAPLATLSPAEKYDLLVGDSNFTLTKANWQKGLDSLKEYKRVVRWIGLCHGWAPASFLEPQAIRPVTINLRDGRNLTFNPSDIHALSTSLWADSLPEDSISFIGRICPIKNPHRDEVGRVVDPKCFTTNPGTWHLAIVNRLGLAKKGFIMDATFDFEIWNQPVISYKYEYFNPQTLETSPELFGVMVATEKLRADKYKKYRSPHARYIVGISMEVVYGDEGEPSTRARPNWRNSKSVTYIYDLELDANFTIVGGEWHTDKHPDFIWAPKDNARPQSAGELELKVGSRWTGHDEIPRELLDAAAISSPKAQPVEGIVRALIELASQKPEERLP